MSADLYEISRSNEYSHHISSLNPSDVEIDEETSQDVFFGEDMRLTNAQVCAVNSILRHQNVLFAGPSASGKTIVTLWAAVNAFKDGIRFAFIVQDEFRADLVQNELIRLGCFGVEIVDDSVGSNSGLIITIHKLRELIVKKKLIDSIQIFMFDNIDQLQDEVNGYAWEEALIELAQNRQSAQYLFTSTNFSNIDDVSRWLTTIYSASFHLILTEKRLFKTQLSISIPSDLNTMHLFNVSDNFTIDANTFNHEINRFMVPRDYKEVNQLADRCMESFPARLTVRQSYKNNTKTTNDMRSLPIVVVTFNQETCMYYALQIGLAMGLITESKSVNVLAKQKFRVTKIIREFNPEVNSEGEELQLMNKLKEIVLNGVGYLHTGMPKNACDFIETLYHRGVIKVLVVTEDIAINSHYRGNTVIVSSCRKFDGKEYRYLTNYEWQRLMCLRQYMKDPANDLKYVTLILDWNLDLDTLRGIVEDRKTELCSKILNSPNTTNSIRNSFHKFSLRRKVTVLESDVGGLASRIDNLPEFIFETQFKDYYGMKDRFQQVDRDLCEKSFTLENIIPYLNCGRLIRVEDGYKKFGLAIVIDYTYKQSTNEHNLYVALKITRDSVKNIHDFKLLVPTHPHETVSDRTLPIALVKIVKVPLECVKAIYTLRCRLPENLHNNLHFLQILINGVTADLEIVKIKDPSLESLRIEKERLKIEIEENVLARREDFKELDQQYKERQELHKKLASDQQTINDYYADPFAV